MRRSPESTAAPEPAADQHDSRSSVVDSPIAAPLSPAAGHGPGRPSTWLRRYRLAALVGGLGVIAAAMSPPVDDAADHAFSSHMLQHVALIYLAAPLLAIAWPLVGRRRRALAQLPGAAFLAQPATAVGLATAALWVWHLPAAYDLALAHPAVHVLEHLSFLGAYLLYWRLLAGTGASSKLTTNEARVLYLVVGATLMVPLGAILTFSDQIFYTHYATTLPPGGRSPLAHQQLGGAIMWLSGPLAYGVAAVLTLREDERHVSHRLPDHRRQEMAARDDGESRC